MAARNLDFMQTLGRNKTMICGSFVPNGAGAIDNSLNTGKGFTVAYTAAGRYTVTFSDEYGKCMSAHASLVQATRTQTVEVESIDPQAPTMVIHSSNLDGAAWSNVDVTAAAGTRIHFTAHFDDSLDN